MDGVLVDMLPYWLERYNLKTQENVSVNDVCQWDISKSLEWPDIAYLILEECGFFQRPQPFKDCIKYFSKLILDERFEVIILTQLPRSSVWGAHDKRIWTKRYFPSFDIANIIFAHRKEFVKGDYFIDDSPTHLRNWKRNNPKGLTIKVNHPYNKEQFANCSANNWKEVYDFIGAAEKEAEEEG